MIDKFTEYVVKMGGDVDENDINSLEIHINKYTKKACLFQHAFFCYF